MDLVETLLNFVKQVNAIAKQQDPELIPQCYDAICSIRNVLNTLVHSEEQIESPDKDVEWIGALKDLSRSIYLFVLQLAECSSDSDSSEHDYVNVTSGGNSDSDGPEEI